MKKLRNIIVLIIAIVGVTPFIANAAEASINNWSLKCDKTDYIYPGERVKCHIFGQVTNATGTDSNVKYLKSRVTGKAVKIISEGSSTNLTSETHQHLPGESDCPNETNDAGSVLKCYEWYHKTNPTILKDTSSPLSVDGFQEKNDFYYVEFEILPDQLTSDTECAKLCFYANYVLESDANGVEFIPTTSNGGCIEPHYSEPLVCKCNSEYCFDNKGKIVSEEEYQKACGCRIEDGKYYGPDNNEVTEDKYKEVCGCRIVGDKHYGPDNTEITEEKYNEVCNPKCYCNNEGQCYDDKGKPVPEEEYKKSCGCRIENGKYYDDNNNEVEEEIFNKVCNPKCYCNSEGQCYDGKGKPVSKEQYIKSCGCRKENGKFYDQEGNEVDEATWNAKCVPGTGSFVPYISILTLLLASYGMFNIIKYYRNNKKIYKV